jgi:hypothetical protein
MTSMHSGLGRPTWLVALVSAAVSLMLVLFASSARGLATNSPSAALTTTVGSPNSVYDAVRPPSETEGTTRHVARSGRTVAARPGLQIGTVLFTLPAILAAKAATVAEGADVAATTGLRDAAESCLNSFTADTPVTMANGKEEPIADVKVGDKVLATDPETGRTEARPVVALIRHVGKHTMVDLTLDDGSKISTTDHHPFWDATTRRFTDAIDLHVGERVLSDKDRTLTISATHVYGRNLTAYNLQVDGLHTYYAGTTPVLVHNSCGGNPLDGTRYGQKVLDQASSGDYHSFPESVGGFANPSHATVELGGDGAPYTHVRIPGGYGGDEGVFHYIFGGDGVITHRLFEPF